VEISACIFNPNKDDAAFLQKYVAAVLFRADYRAKVISCGSDTALKNLTAKYPAIDLLFLPATSFGIGFGEELRRTNRTATIVFTSDNDENVYRAFNALPIAYLADCSDRKMLSSAILRAASWASAGKKVFCHESRTQIFQLKYSDIDYFESEYRIVHIHKADGTSETITAKLDEVEATLPSDIFCRCHKSYLVNLKNIVRVNKSQKTILLRSGAVVFASKAQYPTLAAALKGDVVDEKI